MRTVNAAGLAIGDDAPPRIMGVLNVSKESPYKPSVFNDSAEAAEYVDTELIDQGADIVDIGLESANKKFEVLSAEDELDRLETALAVVESVSGDAVFSIETRYHEVAEAAIEGGFDMVNDICGFADPEMPRVCEEYDVAVAKMASPPDLERPGAVERVDDIYDALELNGFTDKTIVDPAFGGWSEEKTLEDDRETFHRLREFRGYGRPILVSINRKNFLRDVAGRSTEEALSVSLAATAMAVERGAHVVRTHDVAETRDAALIGREFTRERVRETGDIAIEELDVTTAGDAARHLDRLGADTEPAAESVVRTVELTGVSDEERATLDTVAREAGVTFVVGSDRDRLLLLGTPGGFARLRAAVDDPDGTLDAALERLPTA
ncbi:dihydropteroate synthase [Salinigranum rubrum]|uniref:Dihydropteroate synthase n=1 Tax=Salinigranum rubrum TaxID=755307 RepID=A0A2I8VJM7_9EURY|nr:dihydropteroate synthase [Salinigranum rubrum]AUV82143.1 dihydropteroate synthase [Salinigranum rubrum]